MTYNKEWHQSRYLSRREWAKEDAAERRRAKKLYDLLGRPDAPIYEFDFPLKEKV